MGNGQPSNTEPLLRLTADAGLGHVQMHASDLNWVAMTAAQARGLAAELLAAADEVDAWYTPLLRLPTPMRKPVASARNERAAKVRAAGA